MVNHVSDLLLNNTKILIYVIDFNTYELLYINPYGRAIFGDVIGQKCYEALQTSMQFPCPFCPVTNDPLLQDDDNVQWEQYNTKTSQYFLCNHQITQWYDGRLVRIQIGIDITQQKKLETEIQEQKNTLLETFQAVTNATIETLLIYNEDKKCIFANQPSHKLFGYTPEEMRGKDALDFIAESSKNFVKSVIVKADQPPYEALMMRKDGSTFPAILRGKDMILNNKPIRVSAVLDISDLKAKEQELIHQALHDSLTALPNRAYLSEILPKAILSTQRNHTYKALFFIDLDNFKTINDVQGHSIGDNVLIETAHRLSSIIRSADHIFRLGGDEFLILCDMSTSREDEASKDAYAIAKHVLEKIHQPYLIDTNIFTMTASIGVILFCDQRYSTEQLLQYADSAMYRAKEEGKNAIRFFNPHLQAMLETKIVLAEQLSHAIERHEIELFYQKQVTFVDDAEKAVGVEALVRWHHPSKGLLLPGKFVPLAEESFMIVTLGSWIIQHAMHQLKQWESDPLKKEWYVSINISIKQFEEEHFLERVKTHLLSSQCNPKKVQFELTESLLVSDSKKALRNIHALKRLGIKLSIDDFGTGYSSLSYLKRLHVDELKIDKSFVKKVLIDPMDRTIIEMIVTIGKRFNLKIVAEGVETKEQYTFLKMMGCRFFQGFFFSKPSPVDEL